MEREGRRGGALLSLNNFFLKKKGRKETHNQNKSRKLWGGLREQAEKWLPADSPAETKEGGIAAT